LLPFSSGGKKRRRRRKPSIHLLPGANFLSRIRRVGDDTGEMNDWTDMRLLREYSERGSEKAFIPGSSRSF
jgi:hypothetical protein